MRKIYFDSGLDYELTLSLKDYTTLIDSLTDAIIYREKEPPQKGEVQRFKDLLDRLPPITKAQKLKTTEEQRATYEKMLLNQVQVLAKHFLNQEGIEKLSGMSEPEIMKMMAEKYGVELQKL